MPALSVTSTDEVAHLVAGGHGPPRAQDHDVDLGCRAVVELDTAPALPPAVVAAARVS